MKVTVERIGDKLNIYKMDFKDPRQFLSRKALEKIAARKARAEEGSSDERTQELESSETKGDVHH